MSKQSLLHSYIPSFAKKLAEVNIERLAITGYPKEYLQLLLNHRLYYLHIYVHVLDKLLLNIKKKKEEIVLIDYGAGNGLLGMFAKHCGFKKVYLNDVSATFIDASKKVAEALNSSIDGFIEGDCLNALEFSKQKEEKPDAVVGTDVIEHIYRLYDFFNCIKKMNDKMVTVFTTASVTSNPVKNRQLKKLQYADEYKGSNATHAIPGDEFAGLPFIEIRKKIIERNFRQLDEQTVTKLAKATRGMNQEDIIKAGKRFLERGALPKPPSHPTNTCDPVSGSWTERLLTIKECKTIYNKLDFSLEVYTGFYNEWQNGKKGSVLKLANKAIALLGTQGNVLSPFITLVGKP